MCKKGSRKIVVDGVSYFWRVRHKPTYSQVCFDNVPATVSVTTVAGDGQLLHISFPFVRFENRIGATKPQSITPKLIADCIQKAKIKGWQPNAKGQFNYEYVCDMLSKNQNRL